MEFKPKWRFTLACLAALLVGLVDPLPAHAQADDYIAGLLQSLRTTRAPTPVTAKIRCYNASITTQLLKDDESSLESRLEHSMSGRDFYTLFHDKLNPLLSDDMDLANNTTASEAIKEELNGYCSAMAKVTLTWSELTIVQDGATSKNERKYAKNRTAVFRSPQKMVSYQAFLNQAVVSDPSTAGQPFTLQQLQLPPVELSAEEVRGLKLGDAISIDGDLILSGPRVKIEFNPTSRFVSHLAFVDPSTGEPIQEYYQARPVQFAGGGEIPVISAMAHYSPSASGKLRLDAANIFVVAAAEFNREISPADLAIRLPKGTELRDTRQSDREEFQRQFVAEVDVDDASTVVFPPLLRKVDDSKSSTDSANTEFTWWFTFVNVTTILALIAYWVFHSLRTRSR